MMDIRKELFLNEDLKYRDFHSKLIPGLDKNNIIGVRIPVLRRLAKNAVKENVQVSDKYYEERMIKGMMIGYEKCSVEKHIRDLKAFIPLIDNWAVCDCVCATLKFTNKNLNEMWNFILPYLNSTEEYEIRFAVVMMMSYFLTDEYIDRVLDCYLEIKSDAYYVNMAVSWGLSTAFVKYEDKVMPVLEKKLLSPWVHNKAIQKIRESYRADKKTKDYLNTLKI